ncbi:MAG: hypothetical protein HY816_00545 [Candidatus Wallbacteria bacterium]|nr:hypothetical protein [Candidatus Wallbacteria bacterium]
MTSPSLLLPELLTFVFVGFSAWKAIRLRQKIAVLDETPTTPIGRISTAGYFEVKGKAVCDHPVRAPGGNLECVYYRVIHRRRIRESYVDSDGDRQTRTRTEESVTDEQLVPFSIQDRTGKLMVDPLGAEFRPRQLDRVRHDVSGSYLSGLTASWVGGSEPTTTDSEARVEGIPVGADLYAIGRVLRNRNQLCLQRDAEGAKPYILSTDNEAAVAGTLGTQALWWTAGAAMALVVAFILPFMR